MRTTKRFEDAIRKLYTAFHEGTLDPECACQCAVGNICDNSDRWKYFSDAHGSTVLNYVGYINDSFGKRINGYLPSELLKIEVAFLNGCGYSLPIHHSNKKPEMPQDKSVLFNGLSAAITVLCDMDSIPNVMDYSRLFATEPTTQPLEL
ncbi:MAG: Na(+)-translocating NADH-quinone reductase subunit F [Bacteroidia bacterium]|nr:Na(+)-translocating NADH-quinone reductase subunit F [Bacteroidia bacterium]